MATTETAESDVIDVSGTQTSQGGSHRVIFDLRKQSDSDDSAYAQAGADPATSNAAPQPEPEATPEPTDPLGSKVAVVTGGEHGAGREIALRLAASGARVCVLGNDVALLRATVDAAGPGAAMVFLQCDVGSLAEIDGVVDFISRFDRPVDIVVHAEAVRVLDSVSSGAVHDLDEQYLINVRGPYLLTQRLLDRLAAARGRVVFLRRDGSASGGQHRIVADAVGAYTDALRTEVGATIAVTSVVSDESVGDATITDAVLHALSAPNEVEIGEIRLRSRTVSPDGAARA